MSHIQCFLLQSFFSSPICFCPEFRYICCFAFTIIANINVPSHCMFDLCPNQFTVFTSDYATFSINKYWAKLMDGSRCIKALPQSPRICRIHYAHSNVNILAKAKYTAAKYAEKYCISNFMRFIVKAPLMQAGVAIHIFRFFCHRLCHKCGIVYSHHYSNKHFAGKSEYNSILNIQWFLVVRTGRDSILGKNLVCNQQVHGSLALCWTFAYILLYPMCFISSPPHMNDTFPSAIHCIWTITLRIYFVPILSSSHHHCLFPTVRWFWYLFVYSLSTKDTVADCCDSHC